MVFEIKVPGAGFSVTEGKMVAWQRSAGDMVAAGEPVVSVETEKFTAAGTGRHPAKKRRISPLSEATR